MNRTNAPFRLPKRLAGISNQRKLYSRRQICPSCQKKFRSITTKGSPFPMICDKCDETKMDKITIFDRETGIGKIPANLVQAYGLAKPTKRRKTHP